MFIYFVPNIILTNLLNTWKLNALNKNIIKKYKINNIIKTLHYLPPGNKLLVVDMDAHIDNNNIYIYNNILV